METYKDLLDQKSELERRIEEARQREIAGAIEQVRALIQEFGLSEADVFGKSRGPVSKSAGTKVAPKYRDPVSGATWTGRGKAPRWIEGKDRNSFLIG